MQMAQRIFNEEQYATVLVRGGMDGGPVPVTFASGVTISGVSLGAEVEITNDSGSPLPIVQGLQIPAHDEVELSYTGDNLTGVVYKESSVTVATLTLSYSGSTLTSIVKS
jgi:hypothetical protein